ncbi:MAG: hypothetical protein WB014_11770 [Methanosarcina sp.]
MTELPGSYLVLASGYIRWECILEADVLGNTAKGLNCSQASY